MRNRKTITSLHPVSNSFNKSLIEYQVYINQNQSIRLWLRAALFRLPKSQFRQKCTGYVYNGVKESVSLIIVVSVLINETKQLKTKQSSIKFYHWNLGEADHTGILIMTTSATKWHRKEINAVKKNRA